MTGNKASVRDQQTGDQKIVPKFSSFFHLFCPFVGREWTKKEPSLCLLGLLWRTSTFFFYFLFLPVLSVLLHFFCHCTWSYLWKRRSESELLCLAIELDYLNFSSYCIILGTCSLSYLFY